MNKCLFCKIVKGDIPADKVFENESILAFRDINPAAPTHILIIPKIHIPTLNDLKPEHSNLVGEMIQLSSVLAKKEGIAEAGYRTGFNCNEAGGQTVYHLHLHLMGGRTFGWPPG
ncbi:MAG: histidine triad nucleotide-binding protein [Candidatus Marinimicrobia bacterium]|nr:histidine triad nucleotide-binding protein [Candidatus Neomarinimicrobiota bacterium]MBT3502776.1 histidine triad nucleotide-binding protein [Candidatus Neomarinimicrobiota bacterium]MBT3839314.1 histidine triad nucleotide-binding protein [Candidatus Neomarinimicrobiota bacterium]MBT3999069.1 histidine triad nucleotide-binding protein [Candidatus Neomarinimicrobiota bacterium]MBT4282356.1 histidine triad nucleotide-binding protein [Candidatus Neomarinimicrobiota bacterium]